MMKKFLIAVICLTSSYACIAEDVMPVTETKTITEPEKKIALEAAKLSEDQIPLTMLNDKKMSDSGSSSTKAVASVIIVISLIGISYYYVRKYKTSNTINKSNMQIKVLTQHYLGPKKSLAIVHVAGESILIGVTDNNISMIKSLSLIDDEIPADMPKSFGETMEAKSATTNALVDQLDEEFSFAGVTESVSKKIKSMRRFS